MVSDVGPKALEGVAVAFLCNPVESVQLSINVVSNVSSVVAVDAHVGWMGRGRWFLWQGASGVPFIDLQSPGLGTMIAFRRLQLCWAGWDVRVEEPG